MEVVPKTATFSRCPVVPLAKMMRETLDLIFSARIIRDDERRVVFVATIDYLNIRLIMAAGQAWKACKLSCDWRIVQMHNATSKRPEPKLHPPTEL